MKEVQDTSERRARWMRYGAIGVSLIAAVCWTVLAVGAGFFCWAISSLSLANQYGQDQASGEILSVSVVIAVIVLPAALAPWVGVWWWKSRASSPPEASE